MPERLELPAVARPAASRRRVYFGRSHGWTDASVIDRSDLEGTGREGPLIIEEYDSTSVVPPGWWASVDQWKNIHLEKG